MKFVIKLILLCQLSLYFIKIPHLINCKEEPPSVSVNYIPKKQWKMSKLDLADIKIDIEREVKYIRLIFTDLFSINHSFARKSYRFKWIGKTDKGWRNQWHIINLLRQFLMNISLPVLLLFKFSK